MAWGLFPYKTEREMKKVEGEINFGRSFIFPSKLVETP